MNSDDIPMFVLKDLPNTDEWQPMFVPGSAHGAIANGARIVKVRGDPGDTFPLGTCGTILSSIGPAPDEPNIPRSIVGQYGYFIAWDPRPDVPIFTTGYKIDVLHEQRPG